jgi:hypothetical protein
MINDSSPIADRTHAHFAGTVCAAVKGAIRLDSVADNFAPTVPADRRQRMNRAFETVIHVRFTAHGDLECFVVSVAAHLTSIHSSPHFGSTG